jgi:hypothetical protein
VTARNLNPPELVVFTPAALSDRARWLASVTTELEDSLTQIWPVQAQDNLAKNVLLHVERALGEIRSAIGTGNATKWIRIAERLQRDLGSYAALARSLEEDDRGRP